MMSEEHVRELMRRAFAYGQSSEWGAPFTVKEINDIIRQYNDERKVL